MRLLDFNPQWLSGRIDIMLLEIQRVVIQSGLQKRIADDHSLKDKNKFALEQDDYYDT